MDVIDVVRESADGDVDPSCIMPALDLTERGLERVPDTPLQPQVVALDLSVNRILRVDALRLASFGNLTTLSLRSNGLVSLEGLHVVRALRHLDVTNNSVSSFKGLATLEYLTSLLMGKNKMSKLGSLRALTFNARLSVIDLRGNPVTLLAHYKCTLRATLPELLEFDGEFTSAQLQARRRATAAAGRDGRESAQASAEASKRATVAALAVGYGRLHTLSKVKRRAVQGAVCRVESAETAEAVGSSESMDADVGERGARSPAANLNGTGLKGVIEDVRPSSSVPAWRRAPTIPPRARRAPGGVSRGLKSAAKMQVGTSSASASTSSSKRSSLVRPSSASLPLQGSSTAATSTGGIGGHPSGVACTAPKVDDVASSVTSVSGGDTPDMTASFSFCSTADESAMLDASALGFDFHDPLEPGSSSPGHASLASPPSPGGYLEGFLGSTDKRARLQKQQQQRKRVQELSTPRVRREKENVIPATAVAAGTVARVGVNKRAVRIAQCKKPVPMPCTGIDAEKDYESALCSLDCVEASSGAFAFDLSAMGAGGSEQEDARHREAAGEQDLSLSIVSASSLGDLVSAAIAEVRGGRSGDAMPALSEAGRLSVDVAVEMLLAASLTGVDICTGTDSGADTGAADKAAGARSLNCDVLGAVLCRMDQYAEPAPAPESESESESVSEQPVHAPVSRAAWEAVRSPASTPAATSEPQAFTAREEEEVTAPSPAAAAAALSDDAMFAIEEVCAASAAALAVSHAGKTPPAPPSARQLPHTPDSLDVFMDAAPASPTSRQVRMARHCWNPPSPDSAARDDVVSTQTSTPCGVVDLVTEHAQHEQHGEHAGHHEQTPSSAGEVLKRTALPLSKPVRSLRTLKALRDMGRVMQQEEEDEAARAASSAAHADAAGRARRPASPGQWAATRLDVLVRARSLLLNAPAKSRAAARAAAPCLAAAI
jgi:hypothetical protein